MKGRFVKQSEFDDMQHGDAKGEDAHSHAPRIVVHGDGHNDARPEFWGS